MMEVADDNVLVQLKGHFQGSMLLELTEKEDDLNELDGQRFPQYALTSICDFLVNVLKAIGQA